jgi:hypothetical protein
MYVLPTRSIVSILDPSSPSQMFADNFLLLFALDNLSLHCTSARATAYSIIAVRTSELLSHFEA